MKKRMPGIRGFLMGLLVGGITLSTVALLATPRSGIQTRKMLRKQSQKLIGRAEKTVKKARTQTGEIFENTRERANQLIRRTQMNA